MQTMQAALMGAIQGITEFLPVSSSGHIVLTSAFYKILTGTSLETVGQEEIFFDILIHLSTLFAVIIYFFQDLKKITVDFFNSAIKKDFQNENFKLTVYILFATFITGIIGVLIKDFAHKLTESPFIVCFLLMVTGLILFFSEKLKSKNQKMTLKKAVIIGIFQGLAVLPGISRSGMTISSAIFQGIERVEAARFSFILSIPVIILASLIYPIISLDLSEIQTFNFKAIIIGMIAAFVIGYICIKYFMNFLKSNGLRGFAYYCIGVGILGSIFFFFQG